MIRHDSPITPLGQLMQKSLFLLALGLVACAPADNSAGVVRSGGDRDASTTQDAPGDDEDAGGGSVPAPSPTPEPEPAPDWDEPEPEPEPDWDDPEAEPDPDWDDPEATSDHPPIGKITGIQRARVKGYAFDPDIGADPVSVYIYINGEEVAEGLASLRMKRRPRGHRSVGPFHKFSVSVPRMPKGKHTIEVVIPDYASDGEVVDFEGATLGPKTKRFKRR